jgi:EcsC protein family
MNQPSPENKDNAAIQKTLNWIMEAGINGLGALPSAEAVAEDHLSKSANAEAAINSVIRWRTGYATGTGFLTGLGGIATAPITIPASLAASYTLGANLVASIACLRGYDIHADQVRTAILLCLVGEVGESALKFTGIAVGQKFSKHFIMHKISGPALKAINHRVGFALFSKAGQKGAINLSRFVPIAGGIIGGAFDGVFVHSCGKFAKAMFPVQIDKAPDEI